MTTDDTIRDEKLQYNINRYAAKISTLSSGKIDKNECLTSEDILWSKKIYIFYIKKSFRKTNKNDWRSEKKQIKAIKDHGEQLVEYNKLVKKDFNIDRDSIPLEEQKWYL